MFSYCQRWFCADFTDLAEFQRDRLRLSRQVTLHHLSDRSHYSINRDRSHYTINQTGHTTASIETGHTTASVRQVTIQHQSRQVTLQHLSDRSLYSIYQTGHTTASQSQDCRKDDSTKRRLLMPVPYFSHFNYRNIRATVPVATLSLAVTDTKLCIPTQCVYIISHYSSGKTRRRPEKQAETRRPPNAAQCQYSNIVISNLQFPALTISSHNAMRSVKHLTATPSSADRVL